MKRGDKKITIAALTILTTVLLLVMMTWAWIEGTATPGLEGSNMQIAAAPGLIMKIDGALTNVINLNEYCYDAEAKSLTLLEASSADGETLYFREVGNENTGSGEDDVYLRAAEAGDLNTNYLSVTFTLTASETAQKIWLDPQKSYIKDVNNVHSLEAIRVSLKVEYLDNSNKNPVTTILSMRSADEGKEFTAQPGLSDFDRTNRKIDEKYIEEVDVYPLNGYSENKEWLSLDKDETIRITMRLWLEGMDEMCVDPISGSSFDFHIYFDASASGESLS